MFKSTWEVCMYIWVIWNYNIRSIWLEQKSLFYFYKMMNKMKTNVHLACFFFQFIYFQFILFNLWRHCKLYYLFILGYNSTYFCMKLFLLQMKNICRNVISFNSDHSMNWVPSFSHWHALNSQTVHSTRKYDISVMIWTPQNYTQYYHKGYINYLSFTVSI